MRVDGGASGLRGLREHHEPSAEGRAGEGAPRRGLGLGALRAASRRPLATLEGGLMARGVGADYQRMRGWKGSYRISRTSYCKAAPFLVVQISWWWGTLGSYCSLWAGREEALPLYGGQRPREEEMHYFSHQGPAWPREVGVPGTGNPSCAAPPSSHPPFTSPLFLPSLPPSHKLLLVLFWTLESHR